MDKKTLLSYSSARLFFEWALEHGVRLNLDDEAERQALVRICALTEGLPLALELAAVWTGHFTCAEIAAEIASNLDFLNAPQVDFPPRQRSPRAAFDYSWQLLSAAEQRALAQMALLGGRFHREAALAISQMQLVVLLSLVDKSLLRQVAAGWYVFHPLIRQFALEQLSRLGLTKGAGMSHAPC